MRKEKRTDNSATLDIVGRDQSDQTLFLTKDPDRLLWMLDHAETELWKELPDPLVDAVIGLLCPEQPNWSGSATELVEALKLEMQPNALTKRLNVKAGVLAQQYHILYQNEHCRTGSKITLTLQQDTGDDRDGSDDTTKGSLVPQSIVTASQSSQEKEDMYGKDKNITDFAESIGA